MIKNNMRPIHPGEILREDYLLPLGITAYALSIRLHVPAPRVNEVVGERRGITPNMALRLARFLNTTHGFCSTFKRVLILSRQKFNRVTKLCKKFLHCRLQLN
jgi:addiction module HigA family antidote